MRMLVLALIRGYRRWISPLFPACCRYRPSCSAYGLLAVERFGVLRGLWLTGLRILRCNPFSDGGWDPVPLVFDLLGRHRICQPDPLMTSASAHAHAVGYLLAPRLRYHSARPYL
ncbi:MAG: membrane protein insertion efficiency factor YidD [Oscillospiraceae bacterium]|nr:membrane protein insertion efficiency factor YidD [Oscillospiraceae bacterium]